MYIQGGTPAYPPGCIYRVYTYLPGCIYRVTRPYLRVWITHQCTSQGVDNPPVYLSGCGICTLYTSGCGICTLHTSGCGYPPLVPQGVGIPRWYLRVVLVLRFRLGMRHREASQHYPFHCWTTFRTSLVYQLCDRKRRTWARSRGNGLPAAR